MRQHFVLELLKNGTIEPMKYSIVGPLFSLPLAFIDNVFTIEFFLQRYNFLLFYIGVYCLYKLLYTEKEKHFLSIFAGLLFFASLFPVHLLHYYGEVFSATLMMIGIVLIQKNKKLMGWVLMILSVANTPATLFPLVLLCAYKIIFEKNRSYLLLPVYALIVLVVEAKIRIPHTSLGFTNYLFADKGVETFLPYSGKPGFSYPMVFGILGQLFSFGKGLIFFTPGLLFFPLVLQKIADGNLKKIFFLWLIYLAGLILVYSKWWAWYGGWFWGPRFLLFASIPACFSLAFVLTHAVRKRVRLTALAIALWSFWVGTSGVLLEQSGLDICASNTYALEHLCWYTLEYSVLFHPFVTKPPLAIVAVILSFFLWFILIRVNNNKSE